MVAVQNKDTSCAHINKKKEYFGCQPPFFCVSLAGKKNMWLSGGCWSVCEGCCTGHSLCDIIWPIPAVCFLFPLFKFFLTCRGGFITITSGRGDNAKKTWLRLMKLFLSFAVEERGILRLAVWVSRMVGPVVFQLPLLTGSVIDRHSCENYKPEEGRSAPGAWLVMTVACVFRGRGGRGGSLALALVEWQLSPRVQVPLLLLLLLWHMGSEFISRNLCSGCFCFFFTIIIIFCFILI